MLYYQATLKTEEGSREQGRVVQLQNQPLGLLQEENIAIKYK